MAEVEITGCEEDENFDSYKIIQLIDSDFGRKTRKSRALTPTSPTGPQPVATPSAPVPFASPSPTPDLSALAPANTPIYLMQPSGTGPIPGAYMQPPSTEFPPPVHTLPGTRHSPRAYMQPSGIGYVPAPHATPVPYATPRDYMQPPGPLQAAYTQPGIEATPADSIEIFNRKYRKEFKPLKRSTRRRRNTVVALSRIGVKTRRRTGRYYHQKHHCH